MRPISTPQTTAILELPGDHSHDRDLPVERTRVFDLDRNQTEQDAVHAFISHWMPSEIDMRQLTEGAPLELILHGEQHPLVSLQVADPALNLEMPDWINTTRLTHTIVLFSDHLRQALSVDDPHEAHYECDDCGGTGRPHQDVAAANHTCEGCFGTGIHNFTAQTISDAWEKAYAETTKETE